MFEKNCCQSRQERKSEPLIDFIDLPEPEPGPCRAGSK